MTDAIGWSVSRAAALKEAQRIADFKACQLYVTPSSDERRQLWEVHKTAPSDVQFDLISPRASQE